MLIRVSCALLTIAFVTATAMAQLPPDAVDLVLVKISEKQKSVDLCPVYLVPSDTKIPTWEYKGVTYRGSKPDAADKFRENPDKYAASASRKRWENNFIASMSTIWCPVTDQVNPGGGLTWNVNFGAKNKPTLVSSSAELDASGVVFESCCRFCNKNYKQDHFPKALDKLVMRAARSYALCKGEYTEGARSPVEGAIKAPGLAGLIGIWDTEVKTDGQLLKNAITFEYDDGELAGNVKDEHGKAAMEDAYTFEETFFFAATCMIKGEKVEAEYEGERDDNEFSGIVYATVGGEDLELEFAGKKRLGPSDREKENGHDHGNGDDVEK